LGRKSSNRINGITDRIEKFWVAASDGWTLREYSDVRRERWFLVDNLRIGIHRQ
jgi:hypothetical protein